MELPISMCLSHSVVVSRVFLCPCASKYSFNAYIFRRERLWSRLKCTSKPIREELSVEKGSSQNGSRRHENREDFGNVWEDSEFVEVIGIGSRKDAVLDFCLDSPSRSSALRFWYVFQLINVTLLYFSDIWDSIMFTWLCNCKNCNSPVLHSGNANTHPASNNKTKMLSLLIEIENHNWWIYNIH